MVAKGSDCLTLYRLRFLLALVLAGKQSIFYIFYLYTDRGAGQ